MYTYSLNGVKEKHTYQTLSSMAFYSIRSILITQESLGKSWWSRKDAKIRPVVACCREKASRSRWCIMRYTGITGIIRITCITSIIRTCDLGRTGLARRLLSPIPSSHLPPSCLSSPSAPSSLYPRTSSSRLILFFQLFSFIPRLILLASLSLFYSSTSSIVSFYPKAESERAV